MEPLTLEAHRLAICLGPGGVGKTTLSAALALRAALSGRSVDVMTVDPAPRLLDALGLADDRSAPQTVPLTGLGARRGGKLRALKLDPKRTFDELVAQYASSPAARDAILSDRIYHNISNALAGVGDYMAMERLLQLHLDRPAGLIVLDTPPARDAIDFLDAPHRMLNLLDSRAITLLGNSRELMRGPLAVFDLAARAVLAAFDRLTGLRLLKDVQAFVGHFDGMYKGFADRAARAQELIRADSSLVVLVTNAQAERVEQANSFIEALGKLGLKLGAVVVNRIMAPLPEGATLAHAELPPALRRKLMRNLEDFAALKRRETIAFDSLRQALPSNVRVLIAPELGHAPRSLTELAEFATSLKTT
ncbi:MAG: ArsA family ATPase [Candidatus Binataceae bacterium]